MNNGFFSLIENIYFSTNVFQDYNAWHEKYMLEKITKMVIQSKKDEVFLFEGIEILPTGIQRYPYGFHIHDKMDIYFASKIGDNYPIYIKIWAKFLHENNVNFVITSAINYIIEIIKYFDFDFEVDIFDIQLKLSRVDICNHNKKVKVESYIPPDKFNASVVTKIAKGGSGSGVSARFQLVGEYDQKLNYYRYGDGDIAVRIYNKTREVCNMRTKSFFLPLWKDRGLITKREFEMWEEIYKMNGNYYTDYLFVNIFHSKKVPDEIKKQSFDIYNDNRKNNNQKYDILNSIVSKYKVNLIKEITNVEFQMRGDFFRSLKIVNHEDGQIIDYTDIFELIKHSNLLYEHLTTKVFWRVDDNSKAVRKRDKKVDCIWQQIQQTKIMNIELDFKESNAEVYRLYQKNMNQLDTTRKAIKNLSHLYYINADNFTIDDIEKITIDDLTDELLDSAKMNENYFNLKRTLYKQIQYYGQKTKKENPIGEQGHLK